LYYYQEELTHLTAMITQYCAIIFKLFVAIPSKINIFPTYWIFSSSLTSSSRRSLDIEAAAPIIASLGKFPWQQPVLNLSIVSWSLVIVLGCILAMYMKYSFSETMTILKTKSIWNMIFLNVIPLYGWFCEQTRWTKPCWLLHLCVQTI